jgi:hypothetical protein
MAADLQSISTALEAYRLDHGDYPRVEFPKTGAIVLCRALIAPGPAGPTNLPTADGFDGPGFRVRPGGKVWGPYLPADKFKLIDPTNPAGNNPDPRLPLVIADRYRHPILYYPANKASNYNQRYGYVWPAPYASQKSTDENNLIKPMFNASDNDDKYMTPDVFAYLMGADPGKSLDPDYKSHNPGAYDPVLSSSPFTGPFVLWSAGPDEAFGPPNTNAKLGPKNKCDDVANFERGEY